MRLQGTKYEEIKTLPADALPVSKYAEKVKTAVGYVYVKYDRWTRGESKVSPNYSIKCFQGSNFVIPE